MRRALSVIVLNEHGVLSRTVGLFSGRGHNIDSLAVAPLLGGEFSRINMATFGDERVFEQIVKQLYKLIPTYKVIERDEFIEKEMALVKIPLSENLGGPDAVLKAYNGTIANSNEDFLFLFVADDINRIESFLKTIKKYNPSDIVRSGSALMEPK